MTTFKKLIIGLITIMLFPNAVVMLTTIANQAEATYIFDKKFRKHKKPGKCDVPPTWGGVIPGDERFVPTFVDEAGMAHAYCDQQTGLVWEAAPVDPVTFFSWFEALTHCINRAVSWNGQKGGRLPSISELASLVDTTSILCTGEGPCLPDGNPFSNVQALNYWSASTVAAFPSSGWTLNFFNGNVDTLNKAGIRRAWCVRGPMNADAY